MNNTSIEILTLKNIRGILKPRLAESNKGTHGHALLIVGSKCKMGAAIITAKACLRAGVGLLSVNVPTDERSVLQTAIPEAMLELRENEVCTYEKFTALGVGSGITIQKKTKDILLKVLSTFQKPMLLDADALTMIALDKRMMKKIPIQTIITPHVFEFDKMFGIHKNQEERIQTAIAKAIDYKIVIVLKNYETLITYNGLAFLNTMGNAGLAKGGSGDALTGIITSFLAQGYTPFDAAKLGVYLHGLSAHYCLKYQCQESMLISDVINCIGKAFKKILKN